MTTDRAPSLRHDALSIFRAGLEAADPGRAIRRALSLEGDTLRVAGRPYPLDEVEGVYLVGMGKASAAMGEAVEEVLGDRIAGGLVVVKHGHARPLGAVEVREAGHPVPDEAGMEATAEMVRLLKELGPRDLVFCLISGGGSALSPAPAPGLTLAHLRQTTERLLACGATIHEMNAVRKHISTVKGGQLAAVAHPATLVSLLLSDVIGDDPDTIASGPTVPDGSTFQECLAVLERRRIREAVPPEILRHLEAGARGDVPETPGPENPVFRGGQVVVVGSNRLALEAAEARARELGYNAMVLSSFVEGETREVARVHTAIAREVLATGKPTCPPACILSGGETTVSLRGNGKGGRNQEFALAAALELREMEGVVILSGGTDGTDGPTDAAGAVADGRTVARAGELGLDAREHLDRNDAYPFFRALDDLLMTGPTLTNVMDLRLVMVGKT